MKTVTFKLKDQVIIRRRLRQAGPKTSEILVGDILSFSPDGRKATVSLPKVGGGHNRVEVAVDNLQPVTAQFKRARIQTNPAFRMVQ
jgi:hypothetical protein